MNFFLIFSCGIALGQEPDRTAYAKALADFSLKDRYAGCDNADSGRWFLHFQEDGSIKFGFWGEQETPPTYRFDDESQKPIPPGDVFQKRAKWKRVNNTTLEITNGKTKHQFTLVPNYKASNPLRSTQFLTLQEVEGRKRTFFLEFNPRYEGKFKASSVFW